MYICTYMEHRQLLTLRIRFLCEFLHRGGGTLTDMLKHVNRQLKNADEYTIGIRTLQSTLGKLRKGDFIHRDQDMPKEKKSKLFKVTYSGKRYQWHSESQKPVFGELEDSERYTLPFLTALLRKYDFIPAVSRILESLPEVFGITEAEMESANLMVHTGPEFFDLEKGNRQFARKTLQLVIQILEHIHKEEILEFNYRRVSQIGDPFETSYFHRVLPLQIRYYNELYYLVAADEERMRISNFRVDQILKLRVDPAEDTDINEEALKKLRQLKKTFKPKTHFQHVLGIWNSRPEDTLHDIDIEFRGWAGSHILKVRYHVSQTLVSMNPETDTCIVRFRLNLGPASSKDASIESRSTELSYLLGRFHSYAKAIRAIPVKSLP